MNEFVIHHYGDLSVVVSLTRTGEAWLREELDKLPEHGEGRKYNGSLGYIPVSKIESFMDKILQNGFS